MLSVAAVVQVSVGGERERGVQAPRGMLRVVVFLALRLLPGATGFHDPALPLKAQARRPVAVPSVGTGPKVALYEN